MKLLSDALLNLLSLPGAPSPSGASAWLMGDLYEVWSPTLAARARFTTWQTNVVFSETTFVSGAVIASRDRVRSRMGLQVDQLEVSIGHGGTATFGATGITWIDAARSGALDGAALRLWRGFFTAAGAFVDAVPLFGGIVGAVRPRSTTLALTVECPRAKLRANWPKGVLTTGCGWNLYDAGCGLTRPTTWDAKTTAAGSTASVVKVAGFNDSTGFALGTLTVVGPTTSALYGMSRTVISSTDNGANHDVTVSPAFPSSPAAGLTVRLTRGCDKTAATCFNTFGNLKAFFGAPMVPPDSAKVA